MVKLSSSENEIGKKINTITNSTTDAVLFWNCTECLCLACYTLVSLNFKSKKSQKYFHFSFDYACYCVFVRVRACSCGIELCRSHEILKNHNLKKHFYSLCKAAPKFVITFRTWELFWLLPRKRTVLIPQNKNDQCIDLQNLIDCYHGDLRRQIKDLHTENVSFIRW